MKKQVQITINEEILKELQKEAEIARRSLSNYIVWVLIQRRTPDGNN